jgi:deoxyribonuclease-4
MLMKRTTISIGAHVSTAGGMRNAPENGVRLGCECIQVFTRNQMQWCPKPLSEEEIRSYHGAFRESGLELALSHSSYLINLGSPDESKLVQSRVAFIDEIDRCEQLGIPYLVFHPGAHMGAGVRAGLMTIIESLRVVFEEKKSAKTRLLLETTAGQGSNLGCTFEQLAEILEGVKEKERVGVCLDSCHVFAAGYDLRTRKTYEATMRHLEAVIGLDRIKAFHLNDSQKGCGSQVDRHAHIGKGCLGVSPFEMILNDPRFAGIPMVIEVPGDMEDYRQNLQILKKLRRGKPKSRVSVAGR